MALNLALVITGEAASAKTALSEAKSGLDGVTASNDAVAASSDRARDASGRFLAANDANAASARGAAQAFREQAAAQGQMQTAAERFAGVRAPNSSEGRQARQNDLNLYGRALDDLRAKYNPLYAAERAHLENLDGIAAAARIGAISETERASAVARANAIFGAQDTILKGNAASTKLAAHEVTNLSAQFSDLGVQLAGGQSPLMAMIQQGPQISAVLGDRGLSGIISGVGQGLMSLINPTTIVLAAIVGFGYAASWTFDMIRGEVKSTDQILEEHEAFIQRVAAAYPEAARAAQNYARESATLLRADAAAQEEALREASARASRDLLSDALSRPGDDFGRQTPLFSSFQAAIQQLQADLEAGRPAVTAYVDALAAIEVDPKATESQRALARELRSTAAEGLEAERSLSTLPGVMDAMGGAAERNALRIKLLNETAMGFADALGRLQAGDQPALSPREQALKDYIDAAGKALDAREAQAARTAYDARITRIDNAEAGAAVPIPTARPNDIQRLDDAAEATDRLGKQTETVLQRQRDRIALLDLETGAMGQSEDARRALIAALETEQEIRRLGIDVQGAEANAMRANSAEIVRLTQERAAAVKAAREAEKDWSENRSLVKSIFGDFAGLLREGELGWKAWADAALNALDRIISRFADMAIESLLDSFMPKPGGSGASGSGTGQVASSLLARVLGGSGSSSTVARLQSPANDNNAGLMLDEVVVGGIANKAAASVNTRSMTGSVAEQAWTFFKSKGLSDQATAAMLGQIHAESAFNPKAIGDGGLAHGLFQHHPNRGGGPGLIASGAQGQLEHAWRELQTTERGVLARLQAAPDLRSASRAAIGFERPAGWSAANPEAGHNFAGRLGAAQQAMTQFSGKVEAATGAVDNMTTGATAAAQAAGGAAQNMGSLASALMSIGGGEGGGGWFSGLMKSFGGAGGATSFMKGISPLATSFIAAGGVGLFSEGGYTGDGPRDAAAGVVHGQEFVVRASATARHRPMLEAMNAGLAYPGLSGGASSGAGGGSGTQRNQIDVRVWVDDDGTLRAVASEAGAQAGADQADIRVQAFNERLPDRVAEIQQYPRRR